MPNELLNLNDALINSNNLLYAYDNNESVKQEIAITLTEELALKHTLVFSVQTLKGENSTAKKGKYNGSYHN